MLYVIKNGWRLQNQPAELRNEIFTHLLEACEITAFDKEKRIQYDKDMYDERKRNGELAAAKMIGLEKGREEGRVEGREEGREEEKMAVARRMLSAGMAVGQIAEFVGLSAEEILALKD